MSKVFAKRTMNIATRITIVVTIVIAIIIGILKLAERSKDPLRLGVQDFLSELSGGNAEITALPQSKLFPEIIFHAKGIVIRDRADKEKTLVTADDGYFAIDFWRSFTGFNRMNGFEVRNLEMATGYLLPRKLTLVFAGISDPPPHEISPLLLLEGTYNKLPLMMTLEMRRHGRKKPQYDFGKVVPMTFKLGSLEASGYLERKISSVGFEKITAQRGPHRAVFSLQNLQKNPLQFTAQGTIDDTAFQADLMQDAELGILRIHTPEPKKIEKVMDLIRDDFGIDKDSKTFKIEILPNEAKNEESNTE